MIGIGILCWKRAEHVRDVILPAIREHTVNEHVVFISCNSMEAIEQLNNEVAMTKGGKNIGVAGGKNRIFCWFKKLPGLTHLFLFEDDTYPIKRGWDQWYLEAHKATKCKIATFQPDDFYQGITSHGYREAMIVDGVVYRAEVVGTKLDGMMMLSITRRAANVLGGMHRAFEGHVAQEHSELMTRACRAGLCPFTNCTFLGCQEWIDGIDYREWRGLGRPANDPAASKIYKPEIYEAGRQVFFRTCKSHQQEQWYQDPCWDEATTQEIKWSHS